MEVRHAKNESSMIMDRSGSRTSVVLHKFAKEPWLKLRRDDTALDSDLMIAALSTRPKAIEEIDSEEETQTRLSQKKEMLGMVRPWRFASHTLRQVRVLEVPQIRFLSQMRRR